MDPSAMWQGQPSSVAPDQQQLAWQLQNDLQNQTPFSDGYGSSHTFDFSHSHQQQHDQSSFNPSYMPHPNAYGQYSGYANGLNPNTVSAASAQDPHHQHQQQQIAFQHQVRQLQALYPSLPSDDILNAAYAGSHRNFGSQPAPTTAFSSDSSLANALSFPGIANHATSSSNIVPSAPLSAGPSMHMAAPMPPFKPAALNSLSGVAQLVSRPESSAPAPAASASSDHSSGPDTPPLPPAKALAQPAGKQKASSGESLLWSQAKPLLTRTSVERDGPQAARDLIKLLSEFDSNNKFRMPVSTSLEFRMFIIETLNSIANLERGKGFSENGRKRYLRAWIASPAGRHILASWLKQTLPPKKATTGVPDLSKKYKDSLHPLLNVLDHVPMQTAYLMDEAGLGKVMGGLSQRATDSSARKLSANLVAKWKKIIEQEDKAASGTKKSNSPPNGTSTASSAVTSAVKRKVTDVESEPTKRYKSAAVATPSTKTAASSTSTKASSAAKPQLSFFASSSVKPAPKKPVSTAVKTSNAGFDVRNLINSLSGNSASTTKAGSPVTTDDKEDAQGKAIKKKKRVSWKEDGELVAIKLIEPADYGRDDEQHAAMMAKGPKGLEHDEGEALRIRVSDMEEQREWYEPREIENEFEQAYGTESVEGPFQMRRHETMEEAEDVDGQERTCPDESQVEASGTTAEPSEELTQDSTPIYLPEYLRFDEDEGDFNEAAEIDENADNALHGEGSEQSVNQAHSGPEGAVGSATTSGTILDLDPARLQEILAIARGNKPFVPPTQPQSSVATAQVSAPATSAPNGAVNVSALLANLSSSLGQLTKEPSHPYAVQVESSEADQNRLWERAYRNPGSGARQEEEYPGQYYQEETSVPSSHGQQHQGWGPTVGAGGYGFGGGAPAPASKLYSRPCKFWASGNCFRGDDCTFRHDR